MRRTVRVSSSSPSFPPLLLFAPSPFLPPCLSFPLPLTATLLLSLFSFGWVLLCCRLQRACGDEAPNGSGGQALADPSGLAAKAALCVTPNQCTYPFIMSAPPPSVPLRPSLLSRLINGRSLGCTASGCYPRGTGKAAWCAQLHSRRPSPTRPGPPH